MSTDCKQCLSPIIDNKFVKCACGNCLHFICLHAHKSLPNAWSSSTGIVKHLTYALLSSYFSFNCSVCIKTKSITSTPTSLYSTHTSTTHHNPYFRQPIFCLTPNKPATKYSYLKCNEQTDCHY